MTVKRVNYQGISDQCLLDCFKHSRNEQALAELYGRYRISLGNYLKRRLTGSQCVTKAFNSIMAQLLNNTGESMVKSSVATSLFSLAYQQHWQFTEGTKNVHSKRGMESLGGTSCDITGFQQDVIELVFKLNFTAAEAAEIIDAEQHDVQHCLRSVARHNQNIENTLKRVGAVCQITCIDHPSAANQDALKYTAS